MSIEAIKRRALPRPGFGAGMHVAPGDLAEMRMNEVDAQGTNPLEQVTGVRPETKFHQALVPVITRHRVLPEGVDASEPELAEILGALADDVTRNVRRQEAYLIVQPGLGLRQPDRCGVDDGKHIALKKQHAPLADSLAFEPESGSWYETKEPVA